MLDEIHKEHSLFNQLPFIYFLFSSHVSVVPIMVGKHHLQNISNLLAPFMHNEHILFVCNTDFSHVNGHFKHKISGNICDGIRKKDSEIVELFLNHENRTYDRYLFMDENEYSLCGYHALQLMSSLCESISI